MQGVHKEGEHKQGRGELADPNHLLAIHRICKGASVQAKNNQGNNLNDTADAHGNVGVGELFNLKRNCDVGDHVAKVGNKA